MILVFYGENTFLAQRRLKKLVDYYKNKYKSGLNLKFLDLKEKKFQDFKSEILSLPMFSEKKFFILENASQNPNFKENFLAQIEKFKGKDFVILFFEKKDISKDSFFQKLKAHAKFQEFKPLNFFQLKYWIKKEFQKMNREIDPGAIEKLIFCVGNDLWQLNNEIKKLVTYKKRGKILPEDISSIVSLNFNASIFDIIEAIAKKNKKRALKLIYSYLERGEKILPLISVLKFQWRALLVIKDLLEKGKKQREIISLLSFHPFFIQKTIKLAKNFRFQELKKLYQKIFEMDLKIKLGKIDPEIALNLFLLQV